MDTQTYTQCLIAGLLGILFHLVAFKLPAIKKRSNAAGVDFSITNYLKDEWLALASSVLSVIIFTYLIDELVKFKPQVAEYLKFFFLLFGYTGSSILQSILGKADKYLNEMINGSDSRSLTNKDGDDDGIILDRPKDR